MVIVRWGTSALPQNSVKSSWFWFYLTDWYEYFFCNFNLVKASNWGLHQNLQIQDQLSYVLPFLRTLILSFCYLFSLIIIPETTCMFLILFLLLINCFMLITYLIKQIWSCFNRILNLDAAFFESIITFSHIAKFLWYRRSHSSKCLLARVSLSALGELNIENSTEIIIMRLPRR